LDSPKRLDQVVTDLCHCSEHEAEGYECRTRDMYRMDKLGEGDGWEIRGSCALIGTAETIQWTTIIFLDKN
jgi:hypothetical protein